MYLQSDGMLWKNTTLTCHLELVAFSLSSISASCLERISRFYKTKQCIIMIRIYPCPFTWLYPYPTYINILFMVFYISKLLHTYLSKNEFWIIRPISWDKHKDWRFLLSNVVHTASFFSNHLLEALDWGCYINSAIIDKTIARGKLTDLTPMHLESWVHSCRILTWYRPP